MTRHYTITVEVPDDVRPPPNLDWALVREALDRIEPGASGHCLGITYDSDRDDNGVTYVHHRLGVTIETRWVDR